MTTLSKEQLIAEANKEVTVDPKRVTVIYGDYGKRKTTTACSMVNEKGLLISSDDSWKVLLNPRHEELYNKVTIRKYTGLSQLEYIDFNDGYDTIIWDTVSHSVDMFLDLLYDEVKWDGKHREKANTNNRDLKDIEALGFVDYRVTRDKFRPVLNRLFHNTDAHIIFTSQMREPVAGMGKDQRLRPAIPEATFKIIGTRADIIAQLTASSRKFYADVSEDSITMLGKSRVEGIQGRMDLDQFVKTYKEIVF